MKAEQLALAITLRDDATFANFYIGENASTLVHLKNFSHSFIYLWGPKGSGRTHLLQACCHALPPGESLYLDLADASLSPAVFMNMEYFHRVCIDNVDKVMQQANWELALFHFYNRAMEQATQVLMAGEVPPLELAVELPDLHSRLCGGLTFKLQCLTDDQKILALQLRAHARGLNFSVEAGRYLINRYPRDMGALFATLEILDQAALIAKRPLTIPFIKQTLRNS